MSAELLLVNIPGPRIDRSAETTTCQFVAVTYRSNRPALSVCVACLVSRRRAASVRPSPPASVTEPCRQICRSRDVAGSRRRHPAFRAGQLISVLPCLPRPPPRRRASRPSSPAGSALPADQLAGRRFLPPPVPGGGAAGPPPASLAAGPLVWRPCPTCQRPSHPRLHPRPRPASRLCLLLTESVNISRRAAGPSAEPT